MRRENDPNYKKKELAAGAATAATEARKTKPKKESPAEVAKPKEIALAAVPSASKGGRRFEFEWDRFIF